MKNRISFEQLKRWVAFYRVEPFGNSWRRTARLAVAMAAAQGAKTRENAEDMFLPGWDPRKNRQTPEEMAAELAKLAEIAGG